MITLNYNRTIYYATREANDLLSQSDNSMRRLSSGVRVTKAAEGAAELAQSTKLSSQISGNKVAIKNINEGISYLSQRAAILEGWVAATQNIRNDWIQVGNATLSDQDLEHIHQDLEELRGTVHMFVEGTWKANELSSLLHYTGRSLGFEMWTWGSQNVDIQSGNREGDISQLEVDYAWYAAWRNQRFTGGDFSRDRIDDVIPNWIDDGLDFLSEQLAIAGAQINQLSSAKSSLESANIALSSALSRIQDTDIADEMSSLTRARTKTSLLIGALGESHKANTEISLKLIQDEEENSKKIKS